MAVGTVVIRRIPDVDWRVYVAWTAVLVLILSTIISFRFETNHLEIWQVDKGPLLIADLSRQSRCAAQHIGHRFRNRVRCALIG